MSMPENIIRHNDRSLRKPCKSCGRGGSADRSLVLYWAHDTSTDGDKCEQCSERSGKTISGRWVMLEQNGEVHKCKTGGPEGPPNQSTPTPTPIGAPAVNQADAANQIAALLSQLAPTVDMTKVIAEVNNVVNGRMSEVIDAVNNMTRPTIVHVQNERGEIHEIKGYTHKMLPRIIRVLGATDPDGFYLCAMLVGPGGTGKSRLAKQAAEAYGGAFGELSLGPQTSKSDILGYKDAGGTYHSTMFRERYEHGGVMHFDEFDAANPAILTLINGGTSNGHMAFPDKLVKRHPEFRLVCSANTYGNGPDRTYVARQKLDGATKDRFVMLDITYDLELELALCSGYGLPETTVASVLRYVRGLRANAERMKLPLIFGTRASIQACSLLAVGETWEDTIESRVRCGTSEADWRKVNEGLSKPSIRTYVPPIIPKELQDTEA